MCSGRAAGSGWPRCSCRRMSASRLTAICACMTRSTSRSSSSSAQLAEQALARPDVRRLMTIPGVGAITALALVAVIGDVSRFPSPRHLVGYLGPGPARSPVRREGSAARAHLPRWAGARSRAADRGRPHRDPHPRPVARVSRPDRGTARQAGRARARPPASSPCSPGICSRKDEDYRFAAPTITQRKLRTLQRKAGDTGPRISLAGETKRKMLERRFLEEAERNYPQLRRFKAAEGARVPPTGTRLQWPSKRQTMRGRLHSPQTPALLVRGHPRQEESCTQALTFSSGCEGRDLMAVSGRELPRTRFASWDRIDQFEGSQVGRADRPTPAGFDWG